MCPSDREQGFIVELTNLHHVDGWGRFISSWQGELGVQVDITDLIDVKTL
jgi:hypothetical protein